MNYEHRETYVFQNKEGKWCVCIWGGVLPMTYTNKCDAINAMNRELEKSN